MREKQDKFNSSHPRGLSWEDWIRRAGAAPAQVALPRSHPCWPGSSGALGSRHRLGGNQPGEFPRHPRAGGGQPRVMGGGAQSPFWKPEALQLSVNANSMTR